MKPLFGVWALLCPLLSLSQPPALKPLSVGDAVPAEVLSGISPFLTNTASATTGMGAPLVLDFWASWCTSCLASFRKMDSLRHQFGPRLNIIMVNSENSGDDEKKIAAFFKKHRTASGQTYTLSVLPGDTVLSALFPHKLIPHYVWIDGHGKVAAITSGSEVTTENLTAFLEGGTLKLPVKKDVTNYSPRKALLEEGNGGESDRLLFRSTFTAYLEGMGAGVKTFKDNTCQKVTYFNQSVLSLYQMALGFAGNRVVLQVPDTALYRKGNRTKTEWATHLYCYEVTAPLSMPPRQLQSFLHQDLDRYFNLQGRTEKQRVPCYAIVSTGSGATAGQPAGLQKSPLAKLVAALNSQPADAPHRPIVVDESGYAGPLDAGAFKNGSDLAEIKNALQRYGLDLVPAERLLEVFILAGPGETTETGNPKAVKANNP